MSEGRQQGSERRSAPRVPLALRVTVTHARAGEPATTHHARDFSPEGVFLFTPRPLEVGSEVTLEIELPDGGCVSVSGQVVRMQIVREALEPPGLSGMAIRFKNLDEAVGERILRLVEAVHKALETGA